MAPGSGTVPGPKDLAAGLAKDLSWGVSGARALWSARLTAPINPLGYLKLGRDLFTFRFSPAIGYSAGAARHCDQTAVVELTGQNLSFGEAEELTRECTERLNESGIREGSAVAVLGRNSIGLAVAIAAVPRTGADLVYLNTGFQPAQIKTILADRGVGLALVDDDLADRLPPGFPTGDLCDPNTWSTPAKPGVKANTGSSNRTGRHIILTSGTTGKPKGADRSSTPMEAAISLLEALPYRERAVHVLAAPMFHSWGWLNHRLTSLLDTTEIMVPRPSAEAVLDAAAKYRADVIVTTPVVVRRLAQAGPGQRDLSNLRGVLVSGAAIPAPVITSFTDQFGPLIYNLYGSTEVGFATCAAPDDLAADPRTAGKPLQGVDIAILSPSGQAVPDGEEGEIWVGSAASFEGYIDGGDKDRRDKLLSTGDLGHFDRNGRLFVHGRADDLIISGGENVHPAEVEAVLRRHALVADAVAVGRPDPDFGQAVIAHIVPEETDLSDNELVADVRRFAHDQLAAYQRPREIHLRSELPVNETGKVMRRLL